MSWHLLALAALLFLPGFVAFELSRNLGFAPSPLPASESIFVRVALSFVFTSWVSLLLAEAGLFNGESFLVAALISAAAAAFLLRRRQRAKGSADLRASLPKDVTVLVVVLILVLGASSFFPAFEQTIGARDPITYVLSGIRLARQGGIIDHDPFVVGLEPEEVVTFFGRGYLDTRAHYGSRFLGFYLTDPSTGRVEAQGLPLYPTWIGHGYLAAGVSGALASTPLLAIFACIAVFFLCRRTWGTAVGATAALWLVLAPPQVWFARYANAEILAQVLVLIGLYGLVQFRRRGQPLFGLMAAIALGLTWLTTAWLVMLLVPLYCLLAIDLVLGRVRRTDWLWFWLPLGVVGVHAVIHGLFFSWAYIFDLMRVVGIATSPAEPTLIGTPLAAALLATALLASCWLWGRRGAGKGRDQKPRAEGTQMEAETARATNVTITPAIAFLASSARWLLAVAVVLMAAYGYWLRPVRYPRWEGLSVLNLTLGITPLAFGLGVLGVVLLLVSPRQLSRGGAVLIILLGVGIPVLIQPQIIPSNMWALRRFLAVVIPLTLAIGGYALWRLSSWIGALPQDQDAREGNAAGGLARFSWRGGVRWRQTLAVGLGMAIAVGLALALATRATPYRQARDYQGAQAIVDAIASNVEPDAVLIFEARSGWRLLDLAPGLAYSKGFDVVSVFLEEDDLASLDSFFLRQAQMNRPVYFFTQGFNYYFPTPRVVPHRQWSYWLEELEEVEGRLPYDIHGSRIPFASYRLEVGRRNDSVDGILDIGRWDDIYVAEMLPPEADWRRSVRWTEGTAFVWLPGLESDASHIDLRMHSPDVPSQPGRSLRVMLDDVVLGEVVLDPLSWETYSFEVPPEWRPQEGKVPRLTLSTTLFRPADEFFDSIDRRQLGVRLDWVRWRVSESDEAHRPNPVP